MVEPITQHLIDSVIYFSITDDKFAAAARAVLDADVFDSPIVEQMMSICNDHFDRYGKAPQEHFIDEFKRHINRLPAEDRSAYLKYAERVQTMRTPQMKYVLSRINDIVRSRAFEDAAVDIAHLTERGQLDQVEQRIYAALNAGMKTETIGLDYMRDDHPMAQRNESGQSLASTGWELIDYRIRGIQRGRFLVILGKFKGGKTWALCHLGHLAIKKGLTVLHVSHEMGEDEVAIRYDQMIGSLVDEPEPKEVVIPRWNRKTKTIEQIVVTRPSVYNSRAVLNARAQARKFGGRLIIKKYPMGACSMLEISRLLNYLERIEGIVPDILINDYADIMAPINPRTDLRHQINETYIYHKRIADERNIAVVTASQVVRKATDSDEFTFKDFAEDIRKVANVDQAIGISQSKLAAAEGISKVFLLASRNSSVKGTTVNFGSCLDLGMFVTWEAYPSDFDERDSQAENEEGLSTEGMEGDKKVSAGLA